ncbi:MAG: cytochrome C [Desulfuromonadaceae bacterium]|nr:cytochrome C [Desulfuromonadaceae bacterium]
MKKLAGLVMCGSIVWCSSVTGAEAPSLEIGKRLFNTEKLGTSGKSCATCHTNLNKLASVAAYDEDELVTIINQCIAGPLKGVTLDSRSADMKSLVLYLKSLKTK